MAQTRWLSGVATVAAPAFTVDHEAGAVLTANRSSICVKRGWEEVQFSPLLCN